MSITAQPLADFVKQDFRAAAVFEKYRLDFCCGGNESLDAACKRKGINPDIVVQDLQSAPRPATPTNFEMMPIDQLIQHILDTHHVYVRKMLPVISQHSKKVASVHGERHPEMIKVHSLFEKIRFDLEMHLHKEEEILFPFILALHHAQTRRIAPLRTHFGTVQHPIRMMEMEHETAGNEFEIIRGLTDNFTPPAEACNTYKVLLQELDEFERDLHVHIFLENELVHKKAIAVEAKLYQFASLIN